MSGKRTRYTLLGGDLLKDGQPTGIKVIDDYFYRDSEALDIYIEDGHIFVLTKVVPFLKSLKVSSSAQLIVDTDGIIWSHGQHCIFDELTF